MTKVLARQAVALALSFLLAFVPALPAFASDLSITAANVVKGSTSAVKTLSGIASESVTAGQTAYRDPTTKKFGKADANGASALRSVSGIFLNTAGANQPVVVQTDGPITIGATVTVGEIYVSSATAGGIAPEADLTTGHYVSVLGIGISATQIDLKMHNSGVAVP